MLLLFAYPKKYIQLKLVPNLTLLFYFFILIQNFNGLLIKGKIFFILNFLWHLITM